MMFYKLIFSGLSSDTNSNTIKSRFRMGVIFLAKIQLDQIMT